MPNLNFFLKALRHERHDAEELGALIVKKKTADELQLEAVVFLSFLTDKI